jgi:hypothetical protein
MDLLEARIRGTQVLLQNLSRLKFMTGGSPKKVRAKQYHN